MNAKLQERIVIDLKVMAGKPVIKGTRIPVETIVRLIAQGITENEILKDYPHLKLEDIRAALTYAAEVVAHEDIYPLGLSA